MSELRHRQVTQAILAEAGKLRFTREEMVTLQKALENTSIEDLLTNFIPKWEGSLYRHRPVPVREWIESPDHMNIKGQVYPMLLNDLEEIFEEGYREAIFTGSIGFGKSYLAGLLLTRSLYELSCYHNPQLAFGLAEGSPIIIPNVALTLKTAKEIVFEYVGGFVRNNEYFRNEFRMDKDLTRELKFPNNIRLQPVASTASGVIGLNVYSACLDEVNFMPKIRNSSRSRGTNEVYDHAAMLHQALKRRMASRFGLPDGTVPGLLLVVSSAMYPDDFTLTRYEQAQKNEEKVFYRRYSQWEPKYDGGYTGKTFQVALGNSAIRPRMLRSANEGGYDPILDSPGYYTESGIELIDVPEEHRHEFEGDVDMAIRDVAGYPTLAKHPFFPDMSIWNRAFERGEAKGLRHPWTKEEHVTLQDGSGWIRERLDFDRRHMPHFVHIDLALTQDAAGLGIVRVDGVEEVTYNRLTENLETGEIEETPATEYAARMTAILTQQVVPVKGSEIPLAHIRRIILDLVNWGFNIQLVTFDQFNSADSVQQLRQFNVESDRLSVDRTMDPYLNLKEVLTEDRLDLYEHPVVRREASTVERDVAKKKIDHPANSSKDVLDGLTGAVWNATAWVQDNAGTIVTGGFDDTPLQMPFPVEMGGFDDDDLSGWELY